MTETNFPVKLKLRIDWGDVDSFGHVNNVAIFKYIQASRVKYIEKLGLTKMYNESNIGPVLASCQCEFKIPLYYPGQITILSRVDFIKNTSFCICHQIINNTSLVTGEARDILVLFDFNENSKVEIPQKLRIQIEKLEGKTF